MPATLEISEAKVGDLVNCLGCALSFHEIYQKGVPFSGLAFLNFWTPILEQGNGVMLLLKADGRVVGGIGGVITRFQTSTEQHLVEMFWWVDPEWRGRKAITLLKEWEKWGIDRGVDSILMTYMESSEPEKMKRLYTSLGYAPFESHYVKEVG